MFLPPHFELYFLRGMNRLVLCLTNDFIYAYNGGMNKFWQEVVGAGLAILFCEISIPFAIIFLICASFWVYAD